MTPFYVYLHVDPEGDVFYVGKGNGNRAWSKNRHPLWTKYVDNFGGKFDVKIYMDNLTEDEAIYLENGLMKQYGGQLVNWQNPYLEITSDVYLDYWAKKKANESNFDEVKKLELFDLLKAVGLYKKMIEKMIEYERKNISTSTKYIGKAKVVWEEYSKEQESSKSGKIVFLDRLTLCLKKLKLFDQIYKEIEEYLIVFPGAKKEPDIERMLKRAKG